MDRSRAWRAVLPVAGWLMAPAAGIALVGVGSIVISGWLVQGVEAANGGTREAARRSAIGEYFGGVSAVFSGLALLLLIVTLLFQQRELKLQRRELALQREDLAASRDELRRSAEADMRALHVQLTKMVMDDPALAAVWNDFTGESARSLRQFLFANLTFSHYILAHSWGSYTDADLLVHARNLLASPVFQNYWARTRAHKSDLSPETPEAHVFRLFDQAFADARRRTPPPTT
jgi:hypothetical protein